MAGFRRPSCTSLRPSLPHDSAGKVMPMVIERKNGPSVQGRDIHGGDEMDRDKLSALCISSFIIGIIIAVIAAEIGTSTPFLEFSYIVFGVGLLMITIAEICFVILLLIG